jgi:Kdo2-lipid IVA lauroyltransferase/acyltransferase
VVVLLNLVGSVLARLAYGLGIRRGVTEENLRQAFPSQNPGELKVLTQDTFTNLGRVFAEFLYLRFASRESIASRLAITNPELIQAALSKPGGVILLSAHLANWEWMALAAGIHLHHPLHVVVKNQRSSYSERFLQRMRSRFGNIMVNAGDPRAIFRVLREGKIVAMLADQAAPAESIKVSFFGRRVPTFEGPARFALRTGAALFLAECSRVSAGRYQMTFHHVPTSGVSPDEAGVEELTRRHVRLLENIITLQPSLWLWQHKRWKNAD